MGGTVETLASPDGKTMYVFVDNGYYGGSGRITRCEKKGPQGRWRRVRQEAVYGYGDPSDKGGLKVPPWVSYYEDGVERYLQARADALVRRHGYRRILERTDPEVWDLAVNDLSQEHSVFLAPPTDTVRFFSRLNELGPDGKKELNLFTALEKSSSHVSWKGVAVRIPETLRT